MSSYVTDGKRKLIYERDNYTCRYCGDHLVQGTLSIDHILARSKGGDNSESNLATACPQCQWKKGAKSLLEVGMKLMPIS